MQRVAVIDPSSQTVVYKTVPENEIAKAAGPELTGHSVVLHGHGAAPSYGLFTGMTPGMPHTAATFVLNGTTFAGAAVLYAFDAEGQTMNINRIDHPQPVWTGI